MGVVIDADESVVPRGARVLTAVSSGADSMALLWWLLAIGRHVVVAHVNHGLHELRPGQCDADDQFVREKCAGLGVPFLSRKIELKRKNGHVNEVAAREGRYAALLEMARERGCDRVATAHTATDGLESALLNLMRGAGPNGWRGIAPMRILEGEIWLVRPLWRVPREATREVLRAAGWDWREDASNLEPHFRRNRVRAQVLPLLGEISGQNPDDLAVRYVKNAQIARDEAEFLDTTAYSALFAMICKRENDLVILEGPKFNALDVAIQRRVLRRAAQLIVPDARDLASEKIETTRLAVETGAKRAVWEWRKDLRVEWTGAGAGNRLRFWRVKS
ncbi:MAG: tRNA lysidine(34) synthetase TilS [Armatimonadetes bacterium]|nr:tRNA lysidine(34) synthetase TilS [Armatimonadota bacterium]